MKIVHMGRKKNKQHIRWHKKEAFGVVGRGVSAGHLGFSFPTICGIILCESLNDMSWFFCLK